MNLMPIGRCLRDFSASTDETDLAEGSDRDIEELAKACRLASEDGYAAGQSDARSEMATEYDRRLTVDMAHLLERASAAVATERDAHSARWASETAACLESALERLEQRIADQLTRALNSVIADAAERLAVTDIARNCCRLRQKGDARLSVSGPPHLVEALVHALPGVSIDVTDDSAIELSIRFDETELSTRLSDWRRNYLEIRP